MVSMMVIGLLILVGCNISGPANPTQTPPAPALFDFVTPEPPSSIFPQTLTPVFTPTVTPMPPVTANVCAGLLAFALIESLKTSILSADGALLSSLVSPDGMEVRYFRNGNVIMYTPYQVGFLFETTFQANWGKDPASGLEKLGSFHHVIVPELEKIFNQPYTLHCNEIRNGGASYNVGWPYDKDLYSIYFAGAGANGFLDWHTWVIGVEYNNNKPFLYAMMQFYWEP